MAEKLDRLPPHPSQQVQQKRTLTFCFEGKPVKALEGDTVASALYAEGRRIFTRSFKYHRPRGLLCCSGECPNCLMDINGKPNQRACQTLVEDGLRASAQHAWPSLDHDLLHVIESFDRFLPVGFYYKSLYRPRLLWELVEPIIRRLAGLGRIEIDNAHADEYKHCYEYVDLLVVGGGPAGIEAARKAAHAGISVLLVDRVPQLGGHLRYETRPYESESAKRPGYELARLMAAALNAEPNVRVLLEATAFGSYEGGLIPVLQDKTLFHVRAKSLIVATGRHQYPLVFRNNDLPGVMLSRAALRMVNLFGILPGRRAVVITANDEGYAAALECIRAGVEIAELVDARATPSSASEASELRATGVTISEGMTIREAVGSRAVRAAKIGAIDGDGRPVNGVERTVACDLILLSTAWQGNTALLFQSGSRLQLDRELGQSIPTEVPSGTFAAGEVLGLNSLSDVLSSGDVAVRAAMRHLEGEQPAWLKDTEDLVKSARKATKCFSISSATGRKKNFVCLCEDVTEADMLLGIEEGFDHIETLKRYSTVSMGPCQGRMCSRAATEICGATTGRDLGAVGTTTARPPICPVPLGALGGPEFHPVKLTSIHYKHAALTDEFMDMGVWKRPLFYTSVSEEYEAVRHRAGLIDVGTLGKLQIKGTDAPILLDKVYTHWFSNLKPGRVRYGLMCDESGTILDDGTVARLAQDHYYITTTTGNVDFVEQWIKWWAAGSGWCVHVLNVTSANAAVNLAGPQARHVLSKITETDLSQTGFPYMSAREATVAGVPALLLRIGFVGEIGWEIHFAAEYGEYLWEVLLDAGRDVRISPFGVETQRLLRLEKKHLIVGQDTDALSNPYDSDMDWVIKLDKPDFIGRHALSKLKHQRSQNRLVGFHTVEGGRPADGSAVLKEGRLIGRITSVRFSPQLKKFIGLAWIPEADAKEGSTIEFHAAGKIHPAAVIERAFYDPDGTRMK